MKGLKFFTLCTLSSTLIFSFLLCSCESSRSESESESKKQTSSQQRTLTLWHALRGDDLRSLEQDLQLFEVKTQIQVVALQLPHTAFANKLQVAIPRGNGPDLFIGAHDRIGDWAAAKLIEPVSFWIEAEQYKRYLPKAVSAFTYRQQLYGLPLSCKVLALFYNPKLVSAPRTVHELIERASNAPKRSKNQRVWGLAYSEVDSLYFHAPWLHAYGGKAIDHGQPQLNSEAMKKSATLIKRLRTQSLMPPEVDGALASELFRSGRLAYLINGPWFIAELGTLSQDQWSVVPLPILDETHRPLQPYLSVEGVMISAHSNQPQLAWQLARYLASPHTAKRRIKRGELIALRSFKKTTLTAWQSVFQHQISHSVPLSNEPQMKSIWTPIKRALGQAIIYDAPLSEAFEEAQTAAQRFISNGDK